MEKLPTLYHLSKHKALYSWEISYQLDTVYSSTGQVDGKRVHSSFKVLPKNVGKKNSTTVEQQAKKEAEALWKKKLERKYSISPEDAIEIQSYQPMLADSFTKRKDKINYPISVQIKYNGVRCLAFRDEEGELVLLSRGNKIWENLTHIKEELFKNLPQGLIFDGEIYIHEKYTFQKLMSYIKRIQPETKELEYHVYDCIDENNLDMPWIERKKLLENTFNTTNFSDKIIMAPTYMANSEQEVLKYHNDFVNNNHEGAIVREFDNIYQFGFRSKKILKVKTFLDAEFLVISINSGIGKFEKCPIFTLITEEGKEFQAIPKVNQKEKEQILLEKEQYIGKYATVQYFSKSDNNIPIFPVITCFRLEEDLS